MAGFAVFAFCYDIVTRDLNLFESNFNLVLFISGSVIFIISRKKQIKSYDTEKYPKIMA
jgi:hypothetical protein